MSLPVAPPLLGVKDEEWPVIAGQLESERMLVPVLTPDARAIGDQLGVATTLAGQQDAALVVLAFHGHPPQPVTEHRATVEAETETDLVEWVETTIGLSAGGVQPPSVGRDSIRRVRRAIDRHEIDTVVVAATPSSGLLQQPLSEQLADEVACDVITVNGQPGFRQVPSLLLPVAGGPHAGLAADVAATIAAAHGAWVDILHVVPPDASLRHRAAADDYVQAAYHRIARPETTTTWTLDAEAVAETIIEQSRYYDLTVMGAPTSGRLHQLVYGSTTRTVRADAQSVVLSVRNNRGTEALVPGDEDAVP